MNRLFIGTLLSIISLTSKAQEIKLDQFNKIPVAIKNCGALYTYDTTLLKKKKYILIVDFQDLGLITVAGRQIRLQLRESKLVDKTTNVTTYNGSGYTVILSVKTTKHTTKVDLEEGTLEVSKGKSSVKIKIHGESACDPTKQEGNGR